MDGTKDAIRQEMRRRRRALSRAAVAAVDRSLRQRIRGMVRYGDAQVLLSYVATGNEAPTASIVGRALGDGKRVFLPRVVDQHMIFAEYRAGMPLRPGPFGIPEPCGERFALRDDATVVALVPLLAWDETGARVGRGGGYYDRAFRRASDSMCLIGLGYTFQQCHALPRDPWDLHLDYVLTEHAVLRCRRPRGASTMRKEDTTRNDIRMDADGHGWPGPRLGVGARHPQTPTR